MLRIASTLIDSGRTHKSSISRAFFTSRSRPLPSVRIIISVSINVSGGDCWYAALGPFECWQRTSPKNEVHRHTSRSIRSSIYINIALINHLLGHSMKSAISSIPFHRIQRLLEAAMSRLEVSCQSCPYSKTPPKTMTARRGKMNKYIKSTENHRKSEEQPPCCVRPQL